MGKKKKRKLPKSSFRAPNVHLSPAHQPAPIRFTVPKKFLVITCLVLLAVGTGIYANSFNNEFIWDDKVIIPPNEYLATMNVGKLFSTDVHHFSYQPSNFYRPLQMLSYALNYKLGRLNPFGYHVANTLLHTVNSIVLFLIFCRVNVKWEIASGAPWRWIAAGTALIWLVHPIHTQNTTYVSGRADLLVTFFALLSFYTYTWRNIILTAVFLAGALLSKELALIIPLFYALYDFILSAKTPGRRRLKELAPGYTVFGALIITYVFLRLTIFNFPSAFTTEQIPSLFPRLLTSSVAIINLVSLVIVPTNLSMLRNITWQYSLLNPVVLCSLAIILAVFTGAFFLRKKEPLISFCLFWFFIAYIPAYNIMPMNANMSEHWMYLPSPFLILLCLYLLWKFVFRKRTVFVIILSLAGALAYSTILFQRNQDFKNEIVFFEELLTKRPDNTRAHYNLGTSYGFQGNYQKARYHFEAALKIDPGYAPAYANLGLIYSKDGNLKKAIEYYEKANTLQDNLVENHANLGIAYANTRQTQKAINAFKAALKLNPKHPAALNGLGIEHAKKNEYAQAENYFKKVLSYWPAHPDAQKNLKRLQALKKSNKM